MFRPLKIYILDICRDFMKLLKVKSREYKGKEYYKFRINLPEKLIEEAGFNGGDDLEAVAMKGEIKLRKKS